MGLDGGPPEQITFMGTVVAGIAWSPDARQLVFGALEEGTPAPWLVDVGGASAHRLGSHWGIPSAWTPDSLILLRMRDLRIHVLDPATDRVRPLPSSDSTGFMRMTYPSPDGSVIAVQWQQQSGRGLWLLSSRDSSRRQLTGGLGLHPIGWSNDGEFVYAQTGLGSAAEIRAIPAHGGPPSLLARIPLEGARCEAVPRSDGRRFVCIQLISVSDAWMVENFDPDVARRNYQQFFVLVWTRPRGRRHRPARVGSESTRCPWPHDLPGVYRGWRFTSHYLELERRKPGATWFPAFKRSKLATSIRNLCTDNRTKAWSSQRCGSADGRTSRSN